MQRLCPACFTELTQEANYCPVCGNGDADVVGLPGVHIECKRVERLNIYDAIEQSKNDARDGENPVVMHRRNRKEWLVTMPLDDWMKMYGKALHDN